jgi:hypothetical protein
MPRLISNRLVAACALALALSLSITATAAAVVPPPKNLRVVGTGGKTLAEETVTTATTRVKTSPKATCFGAGTGGSGKSVSIAGNTALGLLAHAATSTASLKPLAISDHFDFGLALCGVGTSVAKGSSSWYLKINHKAQQVSGDAAKIHPGDEVLWALAKTSAPSFTYPNELSLVAPVTVKAGTPFTVSVFSYDEKGKRKPAVGATVTGAAAPTGSDGKATVTLSASGVLAATKKGEIPSNRAAVCAVAPAMACPFVD